MKPMETHKDLIVWQKAIALASTVYASTRRLPSEERYGLSSQLRRSSVSIASNIAEGAARRNRVEFLHFLHIARGSLSELETQMMIAVEQEFLQSADATLANIAEVGKLLNELIRKLNLAAREAHANACSPQPRTRQPDPTANG